MNASQLVGSAVVRYVYRWVLKPVFFRIEPAKVHDGFSFLGRVFGGLGVVRFLTRLCFNYSDLGLESEVCGVRFKNPIGLSAGFDKDADFAGVIGDVGFGFSLVGTITDGAYGGNPPPHAYRLPKDKALVVYYGLKNLGVDAVLKKFKKVRNPKLPYGISVGKTNCKSTAGVDAGAADYVECFKKVVKSGCGSFYTINISCPNTFGGEPFTTEEDLRKLLKRLYEVKFDKPLFLKMPINLSWKEFEKLLLVAIGFGVDGVVIGNLNKNRKGLKVPEEVKGGISGKPTWELSNKLIAKTYKKYGDSLRVIGVGGVFSAEDAYYKLKIGASLVQLVTGMIFEGPQLIGEINRGIVRLMKKDGFKNVSEVVGSEWKN